MRLLFIGDIVGSAGRKILTEKLPHLRQDLKTDFVVVNGENAAAGFGLTANICQDIFAAGADIITTGNHTWDQREMISYIEKENRILRSANYPSPVPGRGHQIVTTDNGKKVLVIDVMAQLFMPQNLNDPFSTVDEILKTYKLGISVHAVIIDFHGEATSEKQAMAHFVDGRASLVVGTHTHVPTADAQILNNGTAVQTDAGMTGDYNSIIGFEADMPLQRFIKKMRGERLSPANGDATLCGVFVETDDQTGKAKNISPVRIGGRLQKIIPEF